MIAMNAMFSARLLAFPRVSKTEKKKSVYKVLFCKLKFYLNIVR